MIFPKPHQSEPNDKHAGMAQEGDCIVGIFELRLCFHGQTFIHIFRQRFRRVYIANIDRHDEELDQEEVFDVDC